MYAQYNTAHRQVNSLFTNNLPTYPYATNDFASGLYRHRKESVANYKYIQFNSSNSLGTMVVDIDRDVYYDDIYPRPNIAVCNKDNAKTHAIYLIKPSVHLNEHSSRKPIVFAQNIIKGLTSVLDGDPNFAHLICKNPLNDSYRVFGLRADLYDLSELAEYVPNSALKKEPKIDMAYGRNCEVFDKCRQWAYVAIRGHLDNGFEAFHAAVLTRCIELNINVYLPMTVNEVKTIAKSISKWVWDNRAKLTNFSKQRARANKLAAMRKEHMNDRKALALEMMSIGTPINEIADTLGVSKDTVWRYQRTAQGMSI